jgi:hypothetical protein
MWVACRAHNGKFGEKRMLVGLGLALRVRRIALPMDDGRLEGIGRGRLKSGLP